MKDYQFGVQHSATSDVLDQARVLRLIH
jgi:hypothetical protein